VHFHSTPVHAVNTETTPLGLVNQCPSVCRKSAAGQLGTSSLLLEGFSGQTRWFAETFRCLSPPLFARTSRHVVG